MLLPVKNNEVLMRRSDLGGCPKTRILVVRRYLNLKKEEL